MALISITSNSKDFSFELNKNPKTGLQARSLREGVLYGFFSRKGKIFNLYFQDHPLKCSFDLDQENKREFEYNDLERYTNAELYLSMLDRGISIKEPILSTSVEDTSTTVKENTYTLNLHHVSVKRKQLLRIFKQDIERCTNCIMTYSLMSEPHSSSIFTIQLTQVSTSIYSIIQIAKVLLLLVSANNSREHNVDEAQVKKYLTQVINLDLSYNLRNIFKVKFLTPSLFRIYKEQLEQSKHASLTFAPGDRDNQRKDFIISQLEGDVADVNIIELGCGRSNHIKQLYKRLLKDNKQQTNKFSYTVIDKDAEELKEIEHLARKNLFTIPTATSSQEALTSIDASKTYIVLCNNLYKKSDTFSVIEDLQELRQLQLTKLVLIAYDQDFYTQYNVLSGEEIDPTVSQFYTKAEFSTLVESIFKDYKTQFTSIGDSVDGVYAMNAVVLTQ